MEWQRPSLAGRRIALDRKWRSNVAHYGAPVKLVTLTPPGQDVLPWGDETGLTDRGERVELVDYIYRTIYNATAAQRASRLIEAAGRAADRWVRRNGYTGVLPRQVGNVKALQRRGVWHFHYVLPMGTPVERMWSRLVHRYMDNAWRRDLERWPEPDVRIGLLFAEYAHGEIARGFYGFGYVNARNPAGRSAEKSARYMARNAAGYMARNIAGSGSHYVSSRITRETGVTMRTLRAVNWLHVRRKLVQAGELLDAVVPSHWSEEWAAEVLRVEALVTVPRGP